NAAAIIVARSANDAVEGHRQANAHSGRRLRFVVRLGFENVRERRNSKDVRRRCSLSVLLWKNAQLATGFRRQMDRLRDRAGCVTDEFYREILARLPSRGKGHARTRERADVQAIMTIGAPAIRALSNLDNVLIIPRRDDTRDRILQEQGTVIASREFETVFV